MVFLQNTNKLCVALWVVLECGIATPAISLHILLSRQNLAIPLKFVSTILLYCRQKSGRRDKPAICTNFTSVAPIPVSTISHFLLS